MKYLPKEDSCGSDNTNRSCYANHKQQTCIWWRVTVEEVTAANRRQWLNITLSCKISYVKIFKEMNRIKIQGTNEQLELVWNVPNRDSTPRWLRYQMHHAGKWLKIKQKWQDDRYDFFFVGRWTNRSCLWCDSRRRRWSVNLAWTQCCRASARLPPAPAPTAPRPPWSPRSAWHSGRAGCKHDTDQIT